MSDEAKNHLEDLREDLKNASEDGHEQADEVLSHVDAYLETDSPSPEHHRALRDQLRGAVVYFEASHPKLAATLDRVVNSLTASGI